jgi:hypothetical protein
MCLGTYPGIFFLAYIHSIVIAQKMTLPQS